MKKYKLELNYEYPSFTIGLARDINDILEQEDNLNEDTVVDLILEEIDNHLIYYADQWELLKSYCLPSRADYTQAVEELFDDLLKMLNEVEEEKN